MLIIADVMANYDDGCGARVEGVFSAPLLNQYMMHRCSVRLAVVEVLHGWGGGGVGVGVERARLDWVIYCI